MKTKTSIKTLKLFITFILSAVLLLIPALAFAQSENSLQINVRIEGISENLFYETVNIPYVEQLSVKDVLEFVDTQESNLTISGLQDNFITAIGDDSSGFFGGWEGWLYKVNGLDATVGIQDRFIEDGDDVLLYYGDSFGVGMQFPEVDISQVQSGILKFTSQDTTYDSESNPVITTNSVVGATVRWYTEDSYETYTTDKQGEVMIAGAYRTTGSHKVQIEKYATEAKDGRYLPILLRLSPDYTINLQAIVSPTTGDNGVIQPALWILLTGVLLGILSIYRKSHAALVDPEK